MHREGPRVRGSSLEGTGFEPSVPRERLVPSFSFTPTFPLARVNRPDPIPKAYIMRGPMVRIRLPPAGRWYGAGGEEMAPSSLPLTDGEPDAPAERLEQVPRRPGPR